MANIKQIIYTLSLIFLLGACTEEQYTDTPSSQGGEPGELVPVKLVLNTQPQQSPVSSATKAGGDVLSSMLVGQCMEISLVKTPVTRAQDEVSNFWVFQFDGTESTSKLIHKHFFGGFSTKDIELIPSTAKNRIIVVANTLEETFATLVSQEQVNLGSSAGPATTLDDFNKLAISYIDENDTSFPRFKDGGGTRLYFSGSTDMVVAANKQADIMLFRGVAQAIVTVSLSDAMDKKGYSVWQYQFVKVPDKSFYHSIGRAEGFPGESVNYIELGKKVSVQLGTKAMTFDPVYLPVNLQSPVPFTTPEMRVTNAPPNATYLQITGLQMDGTIIKNSVVYQIHLGSNFTDDYSVSPNFSYNYNIVIMDESNFDSRVVKFIPGYFGGKLTMYDSQNVSTVQLNDVKSWRFEKRIEVYLTDVNDQNGTEWKEIDPMPSANDLMDGRLNTWNLIGDIDRLPAIKKCLGLNGNTLPATEDKMVWYMPSYGQSLGIYVAGSNTLKTLPDKYYWSSTTNGIYAWGTKIWTGQNSQLGADEKHNLRCIKDLDPANGAPLL